MWLTQEQKMVKWHQKHSVSCLWYHLPFHRCPLLPLHSSLLQLLPIFPDIYIPYSMPCTNTRLNCCPPVLNRRTMLLFFDDDLLVWACAWLSLLPNPLVIPPKDNFPSSCSGVLGSQLALGAPLNQSCRGMKYKHKQKCTHMQTKLKAQTYQYSWCLLFPRP